jgi:tetratricopeptide (TPR) repeat protein
MRFAPLVLLLVADAAFGQAPERKDAPDARVPASWKGQQVVGKLGAVRLKKITADQDGNPVYGMYHAGDAAYVVREEQGDLLLLRSQQGVEGWIEKGSVVFLKDAVEYFTKAIESDAASAALYYRLRGGSERALGNLDAAVSDLTEAIRLEPDSALLYRHRALLWMDKKDYDKGLEDIETALRKKPGDVLMLETRAGLRNKKADYAGAVKDYEEALRTNDGNVGILNNLAWLLATCPDADVRDGRRAVTLAENVVERTERKSANYLDTLAAAYAEVRRFDDAVRVQQEALADRAFVLLVGNSGSERLDLYRQRKAYRQK